MLCQMLRHQQNITGLHPSFVGVRLSFPRLQRAPKKGKVLSISVGDGLPT